MRIGHSWMASHAILSAFHGNNYHQILIWNIYETVTKHWNVERSCLLEPEAINVDIVVHI